MMDARSLTLHLAVVGLLAGLHFILPDYHHGVLARVMVLAVFAMGYNLLFGYAGLLSLGHAMFFGAGMYGTGMTILHLGWSVPAGFVAGIAAGLVLAFAVGLLALRTTGVAFMIVTMMFAQVVYLAVIYFSEWTRGDDGLALGRETRMFDLGPLHVDLADPTARYVTALVLFALVLFLSLRLVRSPFGRVLVAIRENEERTKMLGYDTYANKLTAVVISGGICAAAGAAYCLLFGFVGAGFVSIQYSILPLLWVLLGGAATTLGPLIGTLLMFYLVDGSGDFLRVYAPDWNMSSIGIVGVALVLLVLFFPKGILGTIRERWIRWLP